MREVDRVMSDGRLVIGTKRYSSWSLRGWLAVRMAGLDVQEEVIPILDQPSVAIAQATPAGLVPYLEHRGARIWDSLAIGEYCAELAAHLLPADRCERARARSLAAEMHAGFRSLRTQMPMNCGRIARALRDPPTPELAADLARVEVIWSSAADGFLCGDAPCLADIAYAPVVLRTLSYDVPLDEAAAGYRDRVLALPLIRRWIQEALAEPASWQLARYEQVV